MSGSSVASDSGMSSSFASNRSGTTSPISPLGDCAASVIGSSGQWESSRFTSSFSPTSVPDSQPDTLAEDECAQIASFYSGLFSEVYVCSASASLYTFQSDNSSQRNSQTKSKDAKPNWELNITEGVPVILKQNSPNTNKSVQFIFAERGTGFPLYQDTLTTGSNYRTVEVDFHDFLASNRKTLVGLRMFSGGAAAKFLQDVLTVVSSNAGEADSKQKKSKTPKKKYVRPKKDTISPPCCFSHVIHMTKDDELTSLSQYVAKKLSFS